MTDPGGLRTIPNAFIQTMLAWASPSAEPVNVGGNAGGSVRRMNLNESPYPPSPKAVSAMREACEHTNRYPDAHWRALTLALSERTGIARNRIVLGNGSDELIASASRIALTPGLETGSVTQAVITRHVGTTTVIAMRRNAHRGAQTPG